MISSEVLDSLSLKLHRSSRSRSGSGGVSRSQYDTAKMLTMLLSSSKSLGRHAEQSGIKPMIKTVSERYKRQERECILKKFETAAAKLKKLMDVLDAVDGENVQNAQTARGERYFKDLDKIDDICNEATIYAEASGFITAEERKLMKDLHAIYKEIFKALYEGFGMFDEDVSFLLGTYLKKLNTLVKKLKQH
jgi:hypothetical protein